MAMLSPSLRELWLSDIPSLVKLPSSFQNVHTPKDLSIIKCKNLEVLPTGISLKFLSSLHLSGCSRLRSFPDISTNVSKLELSETAIEEVPWWIENFSRLQYQHMTSCSKLKYVHLNISKLIHLEWVNFNNSGALTGVNLSGCCSSDKKLPAREDASYSLPKKYSQLEFIKCFSLDQDAVLQQQTAFVVLILSGAEVPSYFTHRTTGTSLTNIPLPQTSHSQPFFSFRACALFAFDSSTRTGCTGVNIHLYCQFKGRFGGSYDSYCQPQSFSQYHQDSFLLVLDYFIPLRKDYDHVDMQLHMIHSLESTFILKEWGIRVCEADEGNLVYDGSYETGNSEDQCGESDDCDIGSVTDQFEECENSD